MLHTLDVCAVAANIQKILDGQEGSSVTFALVSFQVLVFTIPWSILHYYCTVVSFSCLQMGWSGIGLSFKVLTLLMHCVELHCMLDYLLLTLFVLAVFRFSSFQRLCPDCSFA